MILNTSYHDCRQTAEAICPFCGARHTDSWELADADTVDCDCGGRYEVERMMEVSYSTKPLGIGEWEKGDSATPRGSA